LDTAVVPPAAVSAPRQAQPNPLGVSRDGMRAIHAIRIKPPPPIASFAGQPGTKNVIEIAKLSAIRISAMRLAR